MEDDAQKFAMCGAVTSVIVGRGVCVDCSAFSSIGLIRNDGSVDWQQSSIGRITGGGRGCSGTNSRSGCSLAMVNGFFELWKLAFFVLQINKQKVDKSPK